MANPRPELYLHLELLTDPARVRLLRLLEQEELSVGELTRLLQLPQSTVSRHLKALHTARWIERRNERTTTLLRLASDLPDEARALWPLLRDNPEEAALADQDRQRLQSVLASRDADSHTFFGRMAGDWDALRREMFGDHFWLPTLLALLPDQWVVADLGCGTGATAALLAPYVRHLFAIDREPAMLDLARRRLALHDNVTLLQADLQRLPLADDALDAALCLLVLHHLEDPLAAITEAARALRHGGLLLLLDMTPHAHEELRRTMSHQHLGFSPQELAAMAALAGLRLTRHRTLLQDPEARGPGLFVATLQKGPCAETPDALSIHPDGWMKEPAR